MDDLSLPEIKALAETLAAINRGEEVRDLLDQLEAGESSVWEIVVILEGQRRR